MLSEIFKPLRNMLFIGLVVFILLSFNLNSAYHSNAFKVTLNNREPYIHYFEKYSRGLIPLIFGTETSYSSANEIDQVVNEIKYDKKMTLDISEYEVYYKETRDRFDHLTSWGLIDSRTYEEIKLHKTKLIIKRKDIVLYDDIYISDISKYVTEPGRYYFQVYVYRKDNFYTTITTHMSFNVIVKGDNYE